MPLSQTRTIQKREISPNFTWRVMSRHNTTRYLAMHFGTGKSRDVLCRACRAARRDMRVTTSATDATRTTRAQRRHHSVD